MNFKEYAKGLKPFISYGKTGADFFVAIIGNFIKDSAMEGCDLLRRKPDTQYRYLIGNPIPSKDAQFVYDHRDPDKYVQWISEIMDDSESYQSVSDWLISIGLPGEYPENECQELLESIFLSICSYSMKQKKPSSIFEKSLKLIKDIDEKLEKLPRPESVPVPTTFSNKEKIYIDELYNAYADAESIERFSDKNFPEFPNYKEDFEDRRIDYYSAVSIERGVRELDADNLSNQFEVLKSETLAGIKDTMRKKYINGYEKMLSTMEKAVSNPVDNYILCKSPYWISNSIKKGVCHHLVNDGKIKWVN
ncbi:ABC-three component system protein [Hutsoniella sourekii]|uniref:ABC-three component system protein n=1 Tax=Hutsoniella sourekii TaxID=87650 RepID=UPI000487A123|nr:ABC-three component system protein [Hutsoniella sourekii]